MPHRRPDHPGPSPLVIVVQHDPDVRMALAALVEQAVPHAFVRTYATAEDARSDAENEAQATAFCLEDDPAALALCAGCGQRADARAVVLCPDLEDAKQRWGQVEAALVAMPPDPGRLRSLVRAACDAPSAARASSVHFQAGEAAS